MAEKKEKNYTFGEKDKEYVDGQYMPVLITPKYKASRDTAINLLNRKEFAGILTEGDFWILMNKTKTGKMAYTGLIISHEGLLKINNILPEDKRFMEEYCSDPIPFEYAGKKGLLMIYRDKRDGMLEIGEIAGDNCKNSYPYAMLLKRTFDRVVKRKADLSGIYSDTEADEFAGGYIDMETGEILETKTPAKAEEPVAAPKEAPKEEKPKAKKKRNLPERVEIPDDVEDYILYITYVVLKDYDESKGKFSDFATYVFTKRLTTKLVNICSRHDLKVGSLDENLQDGTPLMEIIEDKTSPTIPQQVSFNNFRLEISSPKSNTEQERNKTKVIKLLEAGYTGCEIMKILCLTKGKYRYIRDLIEQDLKLSKIKMELK